MKWQVLLMGVVLTSLSGVSHATSCAPGNFGLLLGNPCSIGDKTFTFSFTFGGSVDPANLLFIPEATATSSGFRILGFPDAVSAAPGTGGGSYFYDYFTAFPSAGTIVSSTATLNGVIQTGLGGSGPNGSSQTSFGGLHNSLSAVDASHTVDFFGSAGPRFDSASVGGPAPYFNGFFYISQGSNNGGYSHFDSVDFVLNGSPTSVPEGSEFGMVGLAVVGILGAFKKKFGR